MLPTFRQAEQGLGRGGLARNIPLLINALKAERKTQLNRAAKNENAPTLFPVWELLSA